jgi:anaerobic ribonucleoside-triphosphate reductase activating protein
MDLLKRRVGLIDGVVFSGGEPATDPSLADAIRDVRKLGYKVGLHSAGTHPQRIKDVLPLLDWIGLDIKATFGNYARVTGKRGSGNHALASLEAVLASGVDYECRSTLHPDLLPEEELLSLAHKLAEMNVKNYALQVFRTQGCNDDRLNATSLAGYPSADIVAQIKALFPQFTLRRG